jgi:protein-S-isoprenylcysteine O-methyltransferase Ste14
MSTGHNLTGPISYLVIKSRQRDKTDMLLKGAFLFLQLADFTLTLVAARYGYPELNPLLRASLGSLSLLVVFKFLVPVIISWFVPGRWLVPAILLLCGVVGWNVIQLLLLAF